MLVGLTYEVFASVYESTFAPFLAASLRLQEAAAKLLSDIRGDCKTSQRAINTLVSGLNNITKLYHDVLKVMLPEDVFL